MDKKFNKLMDQLISSHKNGNETNAKDAVNALCAYIKPIEEKLSSTLPSIENENVAKCYVDDAEIVASNYYEIIKLVLKRMHVKKFDEIRFTLSKDRLIDVLIVQKGEEYSLDFGTYIHHNDLRETEYYIEIEALSADNNSLDWNRAIEILKNKNWHNYQC
ncbi:hypothetical protein SDC9_134061 [bioreactor metagenome]|uniref:Uncharacterized protein n=1 Tax=bioreactor metagenome TaxID=1076179 RepID=A0A645DD53_9ZZZZ|nr:hypothetical protein [Oscillospiraceae bacterium]